MLLTILIIYLIIYFLIYGDVIISNINEFLKTFLESAGKMDEINRMDKKIMNMQNKLKDIENKKTVLINKIGVLKKELENSDQNDTSSIKESLEAEEYKLKTLESQISDKNADINSLVEEKNIIIKKCLMKLHTQMKKDYQKVNEDHDKYVDLFTQAREDKHIIERKIMNLKFLVYKTYNVRLN
jgi:seryl-tRNA synthetase